jgi:hypothetical protein
MNKYLIINADDFGLNEEQNEAIKELLENKLITSTSLMAVAPEAMDATEFARRVSFPVGVHITLNSDEKDLYPSLTGAPSLGKDGLWYESKNLTFKAKHKDVRAELEAQYQYIINSGAKVDHADSHCGTVYGINGRRFFLDAFDFCKEHNLPFRFPKTVGFLERQLGMKIPAPVVKIQQMIVRSAEKRGVKLLDDLVSNPWSMDKIKDYDTLRKYYLDAVDNCIDGVTEIFLHPALPNESYGKEWQKRDFEYQLLKSGDLLTRAKEKDVQVVSWDIFSNRQF